MNPGPDPATKLDDVAKTATELAAALRMSPPDATLIGRCLRAHQLTERASNKELVRWVNQHPEIGRRIVL